jgi:hypothetical protein
VVVELNTTKSGVAWCAPFQVGLKKVQSLADIQSNGFQAKITRGETSLLRITGLYPATNYKIFCYTRGTNSNIMTYAAALLTELDVKTTGLPSILLTQTHKKIFNTGLSSFQFVVSARPSEIDLVVKMVVTPVQCEGESGKGKTN